MSAEGIPQIAVVMGSCTAGGAYIPAMSDEIVIVREQGTIYLGGPPLVKAATGEEVSAEELGGAEMHIAPVGVTDHFAEDDAMRSRSRARSSRNLNRAKPVALDLARARAAALRPPPRSTASCRRPEAAVRRPRGHRAPRRRLALPGVQGALRRDAGHRLRAPHGHAGRHPRQQRRAVLARSALKGAHFIELCCQRDIPLLFLQNITGFMVGREVRGGRHRQGRRQAGHRGRHRRACRSSR